MTAAIQCKIELPHFGACEHAYEGCYVTLTIELSKNKPHHLLKVDVPKDEYEPYFSGLGSSCEHWEKHIRAEWDERYDEIMMTVEEELNENQWEFLTKEGYFDVRD